MPGLNFVLKIKEFVSLLRFLKSFGLRVFFAEVANRRRLWSAPAEGLSGDTSISDGMEYSNFCNLAVLDDHVFSNFKSAIQYRAILEHVDYELGNSYFKLIKDNEPILRNLKHIGSQDIGNPFVYPYKSLGKISPTQIRYAKVLQDLEFLFTSLDDISIAEIGVGYGGQAVHILSKWKPSKYDFFDLDSAVGLALKYVSRCAMPLSTFPVKRNLDLGYSYDLVISNYAFSELYRGVQEKYLENVILNSRMGYVIYNHIHANANDSITAIEFAERVPGSQIFEEVPKTYEGNFLVVWGHKALVGNSLLFRAI